MNKQTAQQSKPPLLPAETPQQLAERLFAQGWRRLSREDFPAQRRVATLRIYELRTFRTGTPTGVDDFRGDPHYEIWRRRKSSGTTPETAK